MQTRLGDEISYSDVITLKDHSQQDATGWANERNMWEPTIESLINKQGQRLRYSEM